MENIDHMAKNSLDALARDNLSPEGRRSMTVDIVTGSAGLVALAAGLLLGRLFPGREGIVALIYTVGIVIELIPIYAVAVKGIFGKNLTNSMEILVAIAVTACYFSGSLITGLLIPVILNAAHILEERSIMGGREAIDGLRRMRQTSARLITGDGAQGQETSVTVDASVLEPGQRLLILPGDGFPTDCEIVSGNSNIDQKSLTGEAEPVFAGPGDPVYAGTVNLDGRLTVEVKKKYSDSSFSNIIKLLEQSEKLDIPESRLIDRFMHYYIPFVLAIAAAVALVNSDISRAIAILVVSCPCGQMLVSSAPMVAALSSATKHGILIKNSKFIEKMSKVDAVVFDKTGTLTVGEMTLTGIYPAEGAGRGELLACAGALSAGSAHPVSRAVSNWLSEHGEDADVRDAVPEPAIAQIREISGCGTEGTDGDGVRVMFGKRAWFDSECPGRIPPEFAEDAEGSLSFVCRGDRFLGALSFGDTPREDAAEAVARLKKLGITDTVMLTGDRESTGRPVLAASGVDRAFYGLMPSDKLSRLEELRRSGRSVIAVGDGINDALILRDADIGIAMGAMGSDLAIQSADIALMNNRLSNIPFTLELAGRTKKIIYQNLILSMLVSAVMIILSSFGVISSVTGAVLHNVGAFSVLINSSRLLSDRNK